MGLDPDPPQFVQADRRPSLFFLPASMKPIKVQMKPRFRTATNASNTSVTLVEYCTHSIGQWFRKKKRKSPASAKAKRPQASTVEHYSLDYLGAGALRQPSETKAASFFLFDSTRHRQARIQTDMQAHTKRKARERTHTPPPMKAAKSSSSSSCRSNAAHSSVGVMSTDPLPSF